MSEQLQVAWRQPVDDSETLWGQDTSYCDQLGQWSWSAQNEWTGLRDDTDRNGERIPSRKSESDLDVGVKQLLNISQLRFPRRSGREDKPNSYTIQPSGEYDERVQENVCP
jgi:hypothetical protein